MVTSITCQTYSLSRWQCRTDSFVPANKMLVKYIYGSQYVLPTFYTSNALILALYGNNGEQCVQSIQAVMPYIRYAISCHLEYRWIWSSLDELSILHESFRSSRELLDENLSHLVLPFLMGSVVSMKFPRVLIEIEVLFGS